MISWDVEVGKGSLRVELSVVATAGRGLSATLMGGDSHHLGGVVLGAFQPRINQEGATCDISQICLPGHKDVIAGAEVARILALSTQQPVSVACGIHSDNADAQVIGQLMDNCRNAAKLWVERYGEQASGFLKGN